PHSEPTHPSFLSLLLYRYNLHPDPHPFPTRRSSDLRFQTAGALVAALENAAAAQATSSVDDATTIVAPLQGATEPMPTALPERPDRKSTRLNSSHQIISYAVFCLKKKNTESSVSRSG